MTSYLTLLTSLPGSPRDQGLCADGLGETWPALRVLASCRLRWQVGLERLRASDASLARSRIITALLAALLADADADLTSAAAEPGERDDDEPAVLAKGPAFPP